MEPHCRKQAEISAVNVQAGPFDLLLYHKSNTKSAPYFLFCKKLLNISSNWNLRRCWIWSIIVWDPHFPLICPILMFDWLRTSFTANPMCSTSLIFSFLFFVACGVPAVVKHHIFFAIFSVCVYICVVWVHCSCLKNSACGIAIERNPQPVLWQTELETSSHNCLCFALKQSNSWILCLIL